MSAEVDSFSVIPAEAGIQAVLAPQTNLDAGHRRHDKLSLRLNGGISTIPERDIKSALRDLFSPSGAADIPIRGQLAV